jgi:pSer/pThr/pTyr-binding forkhead associated (FHA) protein
MTQAFLKTFGESTKLLTIGDFVTLGSDSACQIQFQGENISERHCRIERKENGYFIRDMRSATGTYLNDAKIVEAVLQDGDFIRIGSQEILFTTEKEENSSFPLNSRNEVWNEELQALGHVAN